MRDRCVSGAILVSRAMEFIMRSGTSVALNRPAIYAPSNQQIWVRLAINLVVFWFPPMLSHQ